MITICKVFIKAFKEEAESLLEQGDKSPADIACEQGIKRSQLLIKKGAIQLVGSVRGL